MLSNYVIAYQGRLRPHEAIQWGEAAWCKHDQYMVVLLQEALWCMTGGREVEEPACPKYGSEKSSVWWAFSQPVTCSSWLRRENSIVNDIVTICIQWPFVTMTVNSMPGYYIIREQKPETGKAKHWKSMMTCVPFMSYWPNYYQTLFKYWQWGSGMSEYARMHAFALLFARAGFAFYSSSCVLLWWQPSLGKYLIDGSEREAFFCWIRGVCERRAKAGEELLRDNGIVCYLFLVTHRWQGNSKWQSRKY